MEEKQEKEPIVVGATTYHHFKIDGIDLLVIQGFTPEDKEFAYQVKSDPRSGRAFYVNLAGKGSVWKLLDCGNRPEKGAETTEETAAAAVQPETTTQQAENGEGAAQKEGAQSTASSGIPTHPNVVTVGTTVYVLSQIDDGTEVVCLQGCDPATSPDFLWAVRYDKSKSRFYYSNAARGERKWTLPEVAEEARPSNAAAAAATVVEAEATEQPTVVAQNNSRRNSAAAAAVEVTSPSTQEKGGGGGQFYRQQYDDMLQRNVELQTRISVVEGQLASAEDKMTNAAAQHTMEAAGLRRHVEELKASITALSAAECQACKEKDRMRLQSENALLQGIREHTTEMMKKEEERTKFYTEKSEWQTETLAMKVELMTVQQTLRWHKEHLDQETCKSQTFDSDLAAFKAQIAALHAEREGLQGQVKYLAAQLDDTTKQLEASRMRPVRGASLSRGSDALCLECSAQTAESWLPRSRPTADIDNERLLASGHYARCCVCNASRATLLCQDCVQHEVARIQPPVSRQVSVSMTSPKKGTLLPAPAASPRLAAVPTTAVCHLCEIRGAALARQREHIASLESTVARLQIEVLQTKQGGTTGTKVQRGIAVVPGSAASNTTSMQTTDGTTVDVGEQLKDARRQMKQQKSEIRDLRGLLTKHLSAAPNAGTVVHHHTPTKSSSTLRTAEGTVSPSPSPAPVPPTA